MEMKDQVMPGCPGKGKYKKLCSPLGRWFGGKFFLANRIITCIPGHQCYCEAFAGAAWVYFKKPPSCFEIINDLNGDLVNFWRVIKDDPSYLVEQLATCLCSRQIFEELRDMTAPEILSLSKEEQAWRLFYITKCAFAGRGVCNATACVKQTRVKTGKPCFQIYRNNGPKGKKYLFNRSRFREILLAAAERMGGTTQIENLPWQKCLAVYDAPSTFFYLDPPYTHQLAAYGKNMFSMQDVEMMPIVLQNLSGRFLLSLNDSAVTRKLFSAFNIYQVKASYIVNAYKFGAKKATELFITNYAIPDKAVLKCGLCPVSLPINQCEDAGHERRAP